MKIEININESLIESMCKDYCDTVECFDCKCNILPDETYKNCYEKYKKEFFKYDLQNRIDKLR